MARLVGEIQVDGLAELRAGLHGVGKDAARELTGELRAAAQIIASAAATRTPRSRLDKPEHLGDMFKARALKDGAKVTDPLPYARVIEWGGTISPRGTPYTIKGRHMLWGAAEHEKDVLIANLEKGLEAIQHKHGL